ncbi:M18 family aminopeptidase [Schaalia sp. Marseille-Q2122]|uniref:M18 family aminopeptidase n=1 Tax=Schaalia sp. Marseille-Q2122 TaxID=2736604 RepID=UPI00158AB32E|nr:M18 family aminopeptidase [Schaalia sp. Marseille-Q2122]
MTFSFDPTTANALDYTHFLNDCPSSYHAAHVVAGRLVDAGFTMQDETQPWDATPGGHVMIREGAAIAWVVPQQLADTAAFRIVGAHTDSPTFTLKPNASTQTADGWNQFGVEIYGGMLINSWLDRELALAGRVITHDGRELLVRTGALARIPQLAIHLDRSVNSEGLSLKRQQHMHPIWAVDTPGADILDIIARDAGLDSAEEIASYDIVTIPQQGAGFFGVNGEFIASGRQDNLSSVHAGLVALEKVAAEGVPADGDILVFACFDHEEIGSNSRTGAAGPLLSDVLTRTAHALGRDAEDLARMIAASFCVSADAAHSVHPNYAERHDPDTRPMMGRGPVVKINANQSYATDATGIARWKQVCAAAGVPVQEFVSNNDMPCGSTIGPITATRLGIRTVDIGVPLLSMHSAREMAHVDDQFALTTALAEYWAQS